MNKYEPKNREQAFTYQWMNDVKTLRSIALLDDRKAFQKGLETLKLHILSYEELTKLSKNGK